MGYTLNQMFIESVKKYSNSPAIYNKVHGEYRTIKYRELGEKVRMLTSGLVALGVQKGDRIALISENRLEWAIADISFMQIGATWRFSLLCLSLRCNTSSPTPGRKSFSFLTKIS